MITGTERIVAERKRQLCKKGWSPEHDDGHINGELVSAACCYVLAAENERRLPQQWPWEPYYWKPKNRIRNLEKAGALIAAEIDRLLRLENIV